MMEEEINQDVNVDFEKKVSKKNRKKLVNFFIRLFISVLLLSSISIYLFTSISSVNNCSLSGNIYFEVDDIYSILKFDNPKKISLYSVNEEKMEELLNAYPVINDADIKLTPFSMNVSFSESAPSAIYENSYYCCDGKVFSKEDVSNSVCKEYFENNSKYCAEFISLPTSKNMNNYLEIVARVNKKNNMIRYIDISSESLFLYYKSSQDYYYRVKLNYKSSYSIDTYVNALIFNDDMESGFESKKEDLKTENGISYYSYRIDVTTDRYSISLN